MRMTIKLVSVSILALGLAACGGSDEPAEEAVVVEAPAAPAQMGADDEAVVDGEAAEGAQSADDAGEGAEEAAAEEAPKAEPAPEPAPAPVAAATPPAMFAICSACHSVEPGANGLGPSLAGIGGAKAGQSGSFGYSDAMKDSGLTWNAANLDKFLKNPAGTVSGTTMAYGGMSNDSQRKEVVDYLMGL